MPRLLPALLAVAAFSFPALAQDAGDVICMDCHVPEEDWEGMSAAEILADAKDLSNKRHADNADFTDEQLMAMIAEIMPAGE